MIASTLRSLVWLLLIGCPFCLFEWRFAARPLAYRKVLARDLGAYVVAALLGLGSGAVLSFVLRELHVGAWLPRAPGLSPWASIPLAVVSIDFVLYWLHRLLHTSALWRVHRWHHTPRHLYWLAGMRTSMLQQVLYGTTPLLLVVLNVPLQFVVPYALLASIANYWMHANLRFRSRWLEAVLVTPRIHHVHHSIDPRHRGRNFGSLFIIWDRLFGTFFDPDDVEGPLEFGIPDAVAAPRIVLGL